jgi:hypothetical protein
LRRCPVFKSAPPKIMLKVVASISIDNPLAGSSGR